MKVLHLVAGEVTTRAGKGAYWLHRGLVELGVDSKILTSGKEIPQLDLDRVVSISQTKKQKLKTLARQGLDQLPTFFYFKRNKSELFSPAQVGYNFLKHPLYRWADLIHLHWINHGFVKLGHVQKVQKPVVWTMRDMWPITGGCHVAESLDCDRYKIGCGQCPLLKSRFRYDLSRFVFKKKQKLPFKQIQFVGISDWISERARQSQLLQNQEIKTIYNAILTSEFFPVEKNIARSVLGIKTQKKIILTGCADLNDSYKGFDKYLTALNHLDSSRYFLVFFGKSSRNSALEKYLRNFEYKHFGYMTDSLSMRLIYSASDVFVAPSLMETFGKTLAEAMACRVPVVCFDNGGPKEIVLHQKTGYRAKPFDPTDLAKGIDWVLADNQRWQSLADESLLRVQTKFDSKIVAKDYQRLYQQMLSKA